MGTYTIWMCCGQFETEETREEAIGLAAAMMNGDGHTVLAVEGPDGEDLMAEAEAEESRRSAAWLQRQLNAPKAIGRIEVKGPNGRIGGKEYVYSEAQRDSELALYREDYGEDRVTYVPREQWTAWEQRT